MPFPATRYALSDVGSAGGKGSGAYPCAHSQVHRLLRCSQSTQRQVHLRYLAQVRRSHLRGVLEENAASSVAQKENGCGVGQRTVSPRQAAESVVEEASGAPRAAFPAAIQSTVGPYRAGLEAGSPFGDPQQVLCRPERSTGCHGNLLRPVVETQLSTAKIMRHYLRRCV